MSTFDLKCAWGWAPQGIDKLWSVLQSNETGDVVLAYGSADADIAQREGATEDRS